MGVYLPNYFSDKQLKIVYLLCTEALNANEMAKRLNLKPSYVYNALYDAYQFLGLNSSVQLVVKFYQDELFRSHIEARYEQLQGVSNGL